MELRESNEVFTKTTAVPFRNVPLLLGNWSCVSATHEFRPFERFSRPRTNDTRRVCLPSNRNSFLAQRHKNAPNRPQAGHNLVAHTHPLPHTHSPILDRSHQPRTLAVHHCQIQSFRHYAIVVDHLPYQTAPCIMHSHQPTAPNQEPSP